MSDEPSSTLYMPIVSPPTPAPSPRPAHSPLVAPLSFDVSNDPIALSRRQFASLNPADRRLYLSAILHDCSPTELLFVSTTIAPLLKRDFLRDLPPEVSLQIISFLDDPQTLTRASRVSKYWNRLLSDEWIWRRLCLIHGFAPGKNIAISDDQRLEQDDLQDDEDVANMLIPSFPSPSSSATDFKQPVQDYITSSPPLASFGAPSIQTGHSHPVPPSYQAFKYEYLTSTFLIFPLKRLTDTWNYERSQELAPRRSRVTHPSCPAPHTSTPPFRTDHTRFQLPCRPPPPPSPRPSRSTRPGSSSASRTAASSSSARARAS